MTNSFPTWRWQSLATISRIRAHPFSRKPKTLTSPETPPVGFEPRTGCWRALSKLSRLCNQIQVLTIDRSGQTWREVSLEPFDGCDSPAEDPLRNDRFLVADVVNRFLYCSACYACSSAPVRIWEL